MHITKWNKSIWKKLHTVRFQIYDILENSLRQWNYRVRKKKKKDEYLGEGTKGEQVSTKEF